MAYKRIIAIVLLLLSLFSFTACKKDTKEKKNDEEELVNILEQPDDYVGKFKVPSSDEVEDGSTLSIIADINENFDKIEIASKTSSDDSLVHESFEINCYGITVSIFKCDSNNKKLIEARDNGEVTFYTASGNVLQKKVAAANGSYVMIFSSSTNANGEDCSKKNTELIEKFKSLDLE